MSDTPTEPVLESAEPQALPTPEVSPQPSGATPSAAPDADLIVSRLKSELLPELKQYVDRGNQSVKDRRIAGLEKRIEELTSAKTALDAHGGDVGKAARELAIDDLLGQGQESQANLGKVGEDWEAGVREILVDAEKSAGVKVPLDDPELRAAVLNPDGTPKTFPSWSKAYAAVNRVVLRRAKGVPAAMVPAEVAGLSATPLDVGQLTDNLNRLIVSGAPTVTILEAKARLQEAMK